jgi:hypothetical protein
MQVAIDLTEIAFTSRTETGVAEIDATIVIVMTVDLVVTVIVESEDRSRIVVVMRVDRVIAVAVERVNHMECEIKTLTAAAVERENHMECEIKTLIAVAVERENHMECEIKIPREKLPKVVQEAAVLAEIDGDEVENAATRDLLLWIPQIGLQNNSSSWK